MYSGFLLSDFSVILQRRWPKWKLLQNPILLWLSYLYIRIRRRPMIRICLLQVDRWGMWTHKRCLWAKTDIVICFAYIAFTYKFTWLGYNMVKNALNNTPEQYILKYLFGAVFAFYITSAWHLFQQHLYFFIVVIVY